MKVGEKLEVDKPEGYPTPANDEKTPDESDRGDLKEEEVFDGVSNKKMTESGKKRTKH